MDVAYAIDGLLLALQLAGDAIGEVGRQNPMGGCD